MHKLAPTAPPPHRPRPHRRIKRTFRLPRAQQAVLLELPEVRAHLVWERRLLMIRAANALMTAGFSQNRAAAALGLAGSWLCTMLQLYGYGGPDGLKPHALRRASAAPAGSLPLCSIKLLLRAPHE